jgi:hypothetical protein
VTDAQGQLFFFAIPGTPLKVGSSRLKSNPERLTIELPGDAKPAQVFTLKLSDEDIAAIRTDQIPRPAPGRGRQ